MYADQTREALLASSRELFVSNGFTATSVEAITQRALVSKGTFYHHFKDKKAIFAELYAEQLQHIAAVGEEAAGAIAASPEAPALAAVAELTVKVLRRTVDDSLHREVMALAPSVLGEQFRRLNEEVALPPLERLLDVLSHRGDLKPDVPLETTAQLLLASLCEGNHIIAASGDAELEMERTSRALNLMMSGIAS